MLPTPKHPRESERIQALHELNLLDTPPEERFDRLTRLARKLFDVPVALVSLVDLDRQWFKSRDGISTKETPREWAFCSVAIEQERTLVVKDALHDDRFRDNPLVLRDPSIRFYAGEPIAAPGGQLVGAFCIIDREPRDFTEEEQVLLEDLAQMVEREFAALRLATIDELTGLSNRRGFKMLSRQALAQCERTGRPATLLLFDLDGFKEVNDTLGHAEGDKALASFAADLLANYRGCDVVARLGGDEFCVLLTGFSAHDAPSKFEELSRRLEERNQGRHPAAHLRFSVGAADYDPTRHRSAADLLEEADRIMYEQKRSRR
jgi:diguanylate cyclase (GGDEF)-like protein